MRITKKHIKAFREQFAKELEALNNAKGGKRFSEEEIRFEAFETEDYVIKQYIMAGQTPEQAAREMDMYE